MSDANEPDERPRVVVVGAGVAGMTAAVFTARHDFETVVLNTGESILNRNAQIENFPGFPAGVNSRLLLEMTHDQAQRSGAVFETGDVSSVDPNENAGTGAVDHGFTVSLADGDDLSADYVIAASWSDSSYLEDLDVELLQRGSKTYVGVDDEGRAGIEGLYAAGRIAGNRHQAIVSAGSGADVALALLEDSPVPFYHDWVAPEGYFTERGRDVPPGCEEIDEDERKRRERRSLEVMQEYFESPHEGEPTMHPSVVEKRKQEADE